jgi:elongator complex protein 6
MPSQPAVPPLLTPYVTSLPHSSLTVLSSVLDATGNWLVLRFLYAALSAPPNSHVAFGSDGVDGRKKRKVVLVSFLRGWDFWRTEAKRLVSLLPPAQFFPSSTSSRRLLIHFHSLNF